MAGPSLLSEILDHLEIGEDVDYEFKAAQGRDGRGELPHSFWESYSGMSNSEGGKIILGIRETAGNFEVCGLREPSRIRKEIWDGLRNKELASACILAEADVQILQLRGQDVILVRVPRAKRQDRPVFIGRDLFSGTFKRNFEGDYRCESTAVKRMLAEAQEDSRDARILPRFTLEDLETGTLERFRKALTTGGEDHQWAHLDVREILRLVGGWRRDRDSGEEGPTLAGLLAFGTYRSIAEEVPTYAVDYQERRAPGTPADTIKRIFSDGSWSSNLFDFYLHVLPEISSGQGVAGAGVAEPRAPGDHVKGALREALVNSLIHADFSGRIGILITKQPGFYSFRNPGGLRIPLADALAGGVSDCRNRNLQKIFRSVGAAEQMGSGVIKILRAWNEQGWRTPLLRERDEPEMTTLQLPLSSLIPSVVEDELRGLFPGKYVRLSPTEKAVIATARTEDSVTNARVREIDGSMHPADATHLLRKLVDGGFLRPQGMGRGSSYVLSTQQD